MAQNSTARAAVGYGAGPVSVQLTRGRPLVEAPVDPTSSQVVMAPPRPARDRNAQDRLALKHWTRGYRVLVCSLTGGTGRTTVAGLLAATLAGLPFAHIWPPALLVDTFQVRSPRKWPREPVVSSESRLDDVASLLGIGSPLRVRTATSGIAMLEAKDAQRPVLRRQLRTAVTALQDCFAPVIIDTRCGLPSNEWWTRGVPAGFSVVLVVRPDEYSLTDATGTLVWLHDQHLIDKQQVTVVVNHGAGPPTGRTRPAAAALAVRCHGLHHLPADGRLGPGPDPATARPVPARLRLRLAQICLDIWHTSQTPNPHPGPQAVDHPQENP